MIGKYNLATLKPDINHAFAAASGGNDILFDWTPIEIPVGTCVLKTIQGTIIGINGSTGNAADIQLFFAKSIDGVAPATFGTVHAATTAAIAATFRRNIIGQVFIDASATNVADLTYNVITIGGQSSSADHVGDGGCQLYLQGEPHVTRKGFQTIYVAGLAHGAAQDYGTDVDLNMPSSANIDADTTGSPVTIAVGGTDATLVFQPGDLVIGETGTTEMEVVSVDSATAMKVKNITAQIDHAEQLILKNPIDLALGLEY